MKSAIPILGLFLIIGFLWFTFNEFEMPKFLFGDTKRTIAIVQKIDVRHAGKGVYYQRLEYSFIVNDSMYTSHSNSGILKSPKSLGDTLVIEYEIHNPIDNKVLGLKK